MPKLPQGTKPTIMTTKVNAKTASDHFWRPVIVGAFASSLERASRSEASRPHSSIIASCSWSDRKQDPLSSLTFLA